MILGVTGGIATGKSSVARMFYNLGVPVVSADVIARRVVASGTPVLASLVRRFGPEILTPAGDLDRTALSDLVFSNPAARADLNQITHPEIGRKADAALQALRADGHRLIIYEAPLLFEAAAESRVDQILVVMATPDVQLERLIKRDGITRNAAIAKIDAQMPLAEKADRADYLIDNSGTIEQTGMEVEALFRQLTALNQK